MENELNKIEFNLQGDQSLRKGVYANFFTATSGGSESIIDFYFIDFEAADENGTMTKNGVMVSRVITTREKLIELRNMLDAHLAANDGGARVPESTMDH